MNQNPQMSTYLGDSDTALLHHLVDGGPVHVAHLVELVNTDDAPVSEDHGPGLPPRPGYGLHVKLLAGEVLHPAEHDQGQAGLVLGER